MHPVRIISGHGPLCRGRRPRRPDAATSYHIASVPANSYCQPRIRHGWRSHRSAVAAEKRRCYFLVAEQESNQRSRLKRRWSRAPARQMRPLKNLPRRTWVLPEELNLDPDSGENVPIFSGMVGSSESPGMDVHRSFGK